MNQRATLDPHAEPTAPICGTPRLPKMSTQLRNTFRRLAATMVHTMDDTRPMACRLWRSTTKA